MPGLAAKPVIDILVGVQSLKLSEECISPMVGIGYECRGEAGVPGRLYFRKGAPRSHQVHLAPVGSAFWEDHLLFRDFLRAHPDDSKLYEELKRRLSEKFKNDRLGYTESKTEFIRAGLGRARVWRRATE